MANHCPWSWLAYLKRHDALACRQGAASAFRTLAQRLDDQAANWVAQVLQRPGMPDYVFAFHDRDEIGPRMLARIAKRTGLTPDDI